MNSETNETIISMLKNIGQIYDKKKIEMCSKLENLRLRCNYSLNKITKEFIIFLPFDNLNSKNVHLINLELETEISHIIDNDEQHDKIISEDGCKDENPPNNLDENKFIPEVPASSIIEESQENFNIIKEKNRKFINLYEYTKVTEDSHYKKMNINDFNNVSSIGYGKGEEEFYRKIANNSIPGNNLYRNLSSQEFTNNQSSKVIKKLILVNSKKLFLFRFR